ncbi:MAG: hypothetical protein DI586_07080 [Micavibrio aeruginosavorus]|uniref:Uncharacterized protein n=1 Tax=Micavibrio aeruginosavorus TaxID=349221 RepID=A0A2W5FNK9_9BACT|nr:MAG: hypothetical protein DI586_07080 [Micavibrio aeruginosavorus]
MQHPFNVSPYILMKVNSGEETVSELMQKWKQDVRMIRNLAIMGCTPNKYTKLYADWNDRNKPQARKAIETAFDILSLNGGDQAAQAIETICQQLQTSTFNGSGNGPDCRDLTDKAVKALEVMGTRAASDAIQAIHKIDTRNTGVLVQHGSSQPAPGPC